MKFHLFVDVQILADTPTLDTPAKYTLLWKITPKCILKPQRSPKCSEAQTLRPAFGAVVVKDALVGVALSHRGQLVIPLLVSGFRSSDNPDKLSPLLSFNAGLSAYR